ncbi:hypothetical protein B0H14DRAFT_3468711 [Mycena olivaceomarginata]|nr:hypothetical protein B0H14DRAFT_3468711 [Mycena olivaceomarginata]
MPDAARLARDDEIVSSEYRPGLSPFVPTSASRKARAPLSTLRSSSHPSRGTTPRGSRFSLLGNPNADTALFPSQLCTRYCLVCRNKLTAEFEALKPYACDRPLCIRNHPQPRDGRPPRLLCYSAAAKGVLDEPLPKGMALRVSPPDKVRITTTPVNNYQMYQNPGAAIAARRCRRRIARSGSMGWSNLISCRLSICASIAGLIDTLPSATRPGSFFVEDMKRHLERTVKLGKAKLRLKEMENGSIVPAAWTVLRWWRRCVLSLSTTTDANAKEYPSLYVRVPRVGAPELALDVDGTLRCWRSGVRQKSKLGPTSCVALAEAVNLTKQFVSSYPPHFVVRDTEWIMCRHLLIKGLEAPAMDSSKGKSLQLGYQIGELVQQRRQELVEEEYDETVPEGLDKLVR